MNTLLVTILTALLLISAIIEGLRLFDRAYNKGEWSYSAMIVGNLNIAGICILLHLSSETFLEAAVTNFFLTLLAIGVTLWFRQIQKETIAKKQRRLSGIPADIGAYI